MGPSLSLGGRRAGEGVWKPPYPAGGLAVLVLQGERMEEDMLRESGKTWERGVRLSESFQVGMEPTLG